MNKFKDGQEIKSLYFLDGGEIITGKGTGKYQVKKIITIMENGQMAHVPWFLVEYADGNFDKWNGAHIQGISL